MKAQTRGDPYGQIVMIDGSGVVGSTVNAEDLADTEYVWRNLTSDLVESDT